MHTAALREMGLAGEWSYEALELRPEDFVSRVREMPRDGFAGANVTVPHKLAALALADTASDAAGEIGAANTLTFAGGAIAAENTDATGIVEALPRPIAGARALVLGAGGAARAAVWALRRAGAGVSVWNRTGSRAAELAASLGGDVVEAPPEGISLGEYDVVVNATSVGLEQASSGHEPARFEVSLAELEVTGSGAARPHLKPLPVDADALDARHIVVDLAYGAVETPLVAAAKARDASVVDGIEVLVRQGAASLRLWTGMEPSVEVMREAARALR
jgi:shikimate dehydrogenase